MKKLHSGLSKLIQFQHKNKFYFYAVSLCIIQWSNPIFASESSLNFSENFELNTENTIEQPKTTCPNRPTLVTNRWQENWNVLANPCVPRQWGDNFKYIPFAEPSYLTLGANLRERFEYNDKAKFGTANNATDHYLIQRLQIHSDLRLGENLQFFTQFIDARAFNKNTIGIQMKICLILSKCLLL